LATVSVTATRYQSTSQREVLRLRSCCSKKSKLPEGNLRRGALLGGLGRLQELRGREAEQPGEEVVRKGLQAEVVLPDRVVVGLAGERDLVLGAGELLLQRRHALVRLEVGVALEDGEQPAERAAKRALGLGEALHRGRVARRRDRALRRAHRVAARLHHRI